MSETISAAELCELLSHPTTTEIQLTYGENQKVISVHTKLLRSALDNDRNTTSEGEEYSIELQNDMRTAEIFITWLYSTDRLGYLKSLNLEVAQILELIELGKRIHCRKLAWDAGLSVSCMGDGQTTDSLINAYLTATSLKCNTLKNIIMDKLCDKLDAMNDKMVFTLDQVKKIFKETKHLPNSRLRLLCIALFYLQRMNRTYLPPGDRIRADEAVRWFREIKSFSLGYMSFDDDVRGNETEPGTADDPRDIKGPFAVCDFHVHDHGGETFYHGRNGYSTYGELWSKNRGEDRAWYEPPKPMGMNRNGAGEYRPNFERFRESLIWSVSLQDTISDVE